MNIDTEFNVGDSVCYLSGDNICHSTISKTNMVICQNPPTDIWLVFDLKQ